MERTLDYVNPQPRAWTNDEGKTFYFVEGNFDDGSSGSVFCNSSAVADETIASLKALVGKTVDYTLEAGKEYNGQTQWKIKGFPGKPAGGGGGGGSRSGGGGMSHSQAGLLAAASLLGPQLDSSVAPNLAQAMVIEFAEVFTEYLFARRKDAPETSGEGSADSVSGGNAALPATPPADAITLPQMKRLKELGASKGLDTAEKIAEYLSVPKLGDMTSVDAATVIESWS